MTRLVLALAGAGALLWSLLAWGAWAFVDWFAGLAAGDAQPWLPPDLAPLLSMLGGLLAAAGFVGVVLVWLLGLFGILAAALFGLWIVRVMRAPQPPAFPPDRWIGPNHRPAGEAADGLARAGFALMRRLQRRP